MNYDTISVIGLGYIGLPTAAVIASRRKHVPPHRRFWRSIAFC